MGKAIVVPSVDYSQCGFGQVTRQGADVELKSITLDVGNIVIGSAQLSTIYNPSNVKEDKKGVTYSIETGGNYASVVGNVLTVNSGVIGEVITLKVTSTYDPTIYNEKQIEVYSQDSSLKVFFDGDNHGDNEYKWLNLVDDNMSANITVPFGVNNYLIYDRNAPVIQNAYTSKNPLKVGYGEISVLCAFYWDGTYSTYPNPSTDSNYIIGIGSGISDGIPTGRWTMPIYRSGNNSVIAMYCNDGTSEPNAVIPTGPSLSQGYHIAGFTRDSSGNLKIYLDGELIYTGVFNKKFCDTDSPDVCLRIAVQSILHPNRNNSFQGKYYMAKAWTRVLSQSEMISEFQIANNKYKFNL